jgi:pimeloyl-ACP methyl ester carboxylesterase
VTPPSSAVTQKKKANGHKLLKIFLLLLAIALLLLWPSAHEHTRAMSLLARMAQQKNWIARLNRHDYEIQTLSFRSTTGLSRARLYVPREVQNPPAMVVVPGLHQLGMDEPRLVNFAKSLAQTGVEVLTPQMDALADYRVEPQSIDVIGTSAQFLAQRVGTKVGVLGLSFAGGMSLMAAADPKYANDISFVAAVGAQDDVQRVEHYLVEGQTRWPDGRLLTTPPHEYGWLILIYSHPEDFFPPADVEGARESLRLLLHEDGKQAEARAAQLSTEGQLLMHAIFEHHREIFRDKLLADLDKHKAEAIAVSPHDHIQALKARVLLVHGEGDDVIPPSETEWLARDIPKGDLQEALISRAISHVSLEKEPGWRDQAAVIHWVALMLEDTDQNRGR